MPTNGDSETIPSGFFQLPGEIRNSIYEDTYEESNEDDDVKWALKSARVSHAWYNEAMPLLQWHGGTRLKSLTIDIQEGEDHKRREALSPTHVYELLDCLRELNVTTDIQITGLFNDHSEYLQSIKNSMLLPEASGLFFKEFQTIQKQKNNLGMCLDIQRYARTCRRIVDNWDNEHDNKKAASLRALALISPETEKWCQQPDQLTIPPDKIIDFHGEMIPKALGRIEQFNKSITNPRLRRYSKNAPFDQMTDAYNRLYMRKTFLEIKLGREQISVDDPLFYFLEDERYESMPWNRLRYEAYHELPAEVDMMDEFFTEDNV